MPNVLWTDLKGLKPPKLDKAVEIREAAFIKKLRQDDTADGLRIKPMTDAADPRARTGRVTQGWRAVLFRFDSSEGVRTYVYAGTWPHDEGNMLAKTRRLEGNPINGIAQIVDVAFPVQPVHYEPGTDSAAAPVSYLESTYNYSLADLTDVLGFDEASARALLAATTREEVTDVAERFPNTWQQLAALGLAFGDELGKIRTDLGFDAAPDADELAQLSEDDRILRALEHPAAKMQFTYIDSDESLRRIIEEGDFGSWRVFLHPEQDRYATGSWNGPYRLSGGAGTGKTVVLLHRARHLMRRNPEASVVLTTYTRALAENLKRDLARLDPDLPLASALGERGILIRGVDQLSAMVRARAGKGFGAAAAAVVGETIGYAKSMIGNHDQWASAMHAAAPELPPDLLNESFFEHEYVQVVLPARVTDAEEYFAIRRPGRKVALDRRKRIEVWRTIEEYRRQLRGANELTWAELASIASVWLDSVGDSERAIVDHLLVDEAQDLVPSHWQLLRSLVRPGADDLFVAEDSHQRIYGEHVVLLRYGIPIRGRSRRLTLNYRTTEENLQYALGVLAGAEYLDPEGDEVALSGYRSSRRGPTPRVLACADADELHGGIAQLIRSWIDDDVDPATIAVLARGNTAAAKVRAELGHRGVHLNHIKAPSVNGDKPVTLTMHTAKGQEFSRVVLYDVSDGVMPNPLMLASAPADEIEDVLLRERSLLYVAASRARDELVVSWAGEPSSLLGRGEAPRAVGVPNARD